MCALVLVQKPPISVCGNDWKRPRVAGGGQSHHLRFEETVDPELAGTKGERENTPVDIQPCPTPTGLNSSFTACFLHSPLWKH